MVDDLYKLWVQVMRVKYNRCFLSTTHLITASSKSEGEKNTRRIVELC